MSDKEQTQEDYRNSVSLTADAVENCVQEHDQNANDAIFECVDGDRWIIITYRAKRTLAFSDNEPENYQLYQTEDPHWYDTIQAMAFVCYRQDVRDELDRRDNIDF